MKPFVWVVLVIGSLVLSFCNTNNHQTESDGSLLAEQYCGSCHLIPSPGDLNKTTWQEYVLPRMGAMMGVYDENLIRDSLIENKTVEDSNIFPLERIISPSDWNKLKQWYIDSAPEKLNNRNDLSSDIEILSQYKVIYPNIYLSPPSTTYIDVSSNQLTFADANKKSIIVSDQNLNPIKQLSLSSEGTVHIQRGKNRWFLTQMGSFSPTDKALGSVSSLDLESGITNTLIDSLQRPVHSLYADFDNDGAVEIVICEFGKWTGALSYWDADANGNYQRTNLSNRSGAIKSETIDIDQDGDLDIIALFGQGDEGFKLYRNNGTKFIEERLLRFPPSYGSATFRLYDYNHDGLADIIYCAGDNADYPPILKPYHGIYIFEQQSDYTFIQSHFLPLHGCYDAIPIESINGVDFVSISFFPDYSQEDVQSFNYLEQREDGSYVYKTIPSLSNGRWIVSDVGDIDLDGDLDIALGSLSFEAPNHPEILENLVQNGLPYVLLENLTAQK